MQHTYSTLKEALDKYKVLYIPYYQRDYVWGSKNNGQNLYKFIDDIFNQYNNHPEEDYLIGTLAFCSISVNDIIDGQQRITSLILLLSRLATLHCSDSIKEKNRKLLEPKGKFIIQEPNYLTEELKYTLGLPNNYNSQGYTINLSKTKDRIDNQIKVGWAGYTESWYDGLYDYILNKVTFISFEFNNISDSLKYFLNNNSLSIPLTQVEILYSILSQSIRLGNTGENIFNIKTKLKSLSEQPGIKQSFKDYKGYDEAKEITNIIYIFLKTYYQNDPNIQYLDEVGIGRWITLYKTEIFSDQIKAKDFVDKFIQYVKDFEILYNYFTNKNGILDVNSSLYISWVLLAYENFSNVLEVLLKIFMLRHNYIDKTIYNNSNFDINELNEIAKRLNLTILKQYNNRSNDRISNFLSNIKVENGKYNRTIKDLLDDINYDNFLTLTYRRDPKSNEKLNDDSRLIKVVFACQEAFLDVTADSSKSIGEYLNELLTQTQFSVEHIYSIKEWDDFNRLQNWRNKKGKFNDESEFDIERFKFLNLSLLNISSNSSAGSDTIRDKLTKYKNAHGVFNSKPEYLIQSLADSSDYYNNSNIQKLGLPERKITNIDDNTWEHSPNNRDFNLKLLKLAIKYIASI